MLNFLHRHYHLRYHGTYKNAKKLFIFDLGLLALAFTIFCASLFFFFWRPGTTDLVDLVISLGDQRIQSGNYVHLAISYTNRAQSVLDKAVLTVRLPAGFIPDPTKKLVKNSNNSYVYQLEKIEPGAQGQIDIYGRLWTSINQEEKIISALSYTSPAYNRPEQKLAAFLINLPEGVIQSELKTDAAAFAGSAFPYTLVLKNLSDQKLTGISLTNNWDNAANENPTWKNITLEPKEAKTLSGVLRAPNKEGKISLQINTKILIDNHTVVLAANQTEVTLSQPQLSSAVKILSTAAYAEPGQLLPVQINWKNNSTVDYKNVKIRLNFTPGIVDLKTTAKNNNLKIEGASLVADGQTRTALANSRANSGETFLINLKLLSHFSLEETAEKINFTIKPTMEIPAVGVDSGMYGAPGQAASLPLATDLKFKVETIYFTADGEQLGRGPLPPQAGATTKYRIVAQIFNASNDVTNANFTAVLPEGVTFTGQQSVSIGSSQKYDENTRIILWNYPNLPAYSQTTLSFEVAITPTEGQAGNNIELVKNIKFSATDSYTGKKFEFNQASLSNKL